MFQIMSKCNALISRESLHTTPSFPSLEKNEYSEITDVTPTSKDLRELQTQLNNLYQLVAKPQIINLYGFEHLNLQSVSHDIKQRVDTLFFEAHIPIKWKLKVKWTQTLNNKTVVHITMLNYFVKEEVKKMLLNFLEHEYKNIIYID